MPKIPTKTGPANLLASLSPRARAFLSARVNVEQVLGFAGQPGRPELARTVPGTDVASSVRSRRDRRAHAALELAAARAHRRRTRDVRAERRFARRMEQWGAQEPEGGWRGIPRDVWVMAWDAVADGTGAAVRYWMGREPNKIVVGAARAVALGIGPDGEHARTWADLTARRLMVCTLVQCKLAVTTKRAGRWTELVRGVPMGAFAAMLTPPQTGARRPHINALCGRHRGAQSQERRGQLGYLLELERGGVLYSQQLPAGDVDAFERCGPSGHACNRYWLLSPVPTHAHDQAERERLIALHRAGQAAATEPLTTAVRPRKIDESRVQRLRAVVLGASTHPPG